MKVIPQKYQRYWATIWWNLYNPNSTFFDWSAHVIDRWTAGRQWAIVYSDLSI